MPEKCDILEELRWMPGLADCDLRMYLRAARSMAAFAGMCDGGSAEDGCLAASRDDTTINALQLLHESNYDTGKALQALVKSPVPKGIEKKWTEEEQKRFVKGLRLYGKNFFKIKKELLSHKETPDLVEYYYLWKKTPQAASARPHRRHRRCVLRRIRNAANNTNANSNSQSKANIVNKDDGSSASEEEVEQTDDSDSNANTDLTCSNCGVLAKELRQTGTDRSLLCKECRTYMKAHGKHRPLDEKDKFTFKGEGDSLSNGKPNLRTRKGKDKSSKGELNRGNSKSSETSSPERNDMNSAESSSSSSEAKPSNCPSVSSETETNKKVDIPKKRPFSNLDMDPSNETGDIPKEGDGDSKRKKLNSENEGDEKLEENEECTTEGTSEDVKPIKEEADEACDEKPEPSVDNDLEMKVDDSDHSVDKEQVEIKTEKEDDKEANELEIEKPEAAQTAVDNVAEEKGDITASQSSDRNTDDSPDGTDKEKPEPSSLASVKDEPPSSPKSPQDLSSLSTREKRSETVPCINSQSSTPSTISNPSTSPLIKKEDNSALNFTPSSVSKVSPSSSPNPLMFPFSQSFPQIPPSLPVSSNSMADRFPYLMPPLNFPPAVGLPPENIASSPKPPSSLSSEKFEGELKLKEESKSSEHNSAKSSIKSESNRNLSSPKIPATSAASFPTLGSPFTSTPSDPFLLANPSFAASHLGPGGERLPFPNPLINYPPGFAPHIPGLPPFMNPVNPWSQYARLPPGAFPPYMPGHAGSPSQMSHSPHSNPMSKSKSPITSQSSSHHNSPSHFSSHSLKSTDNKESFDRRERDLFQQDDDDMDNSYLSRGPSPEPKIEDSECHRSQSAIFLRHWNRGDYNSCARTDLTFKPVPDSQLSRKREERARKAAEKEREDHTKSDKLAPLELKPSNNHGMSQSSASHESSSHLISPLGGRHTPRNFDTPALRQLSEYARPHSTYSPFSHPQMPHHMQPSNIPPLAMHGPNPTGASQIDPLALAQFQLFKDAEEKQKMAILEKQKEMELKSRSSSQVVQHNPSMPATSSSSSIFDQHLLEMQRRLVSSNPTLSNSPSMANPSTSSANGLPLSASAVAPSLNPVIPIFSPNERAAQEQMQQMAAAVAAADRYQVDQARLAMDPLFRLQMSLNPELHGAPGAANPAHAFQHGPHSVHSGAHPSANASAESQAAASMQLAAAAAAMGLPGAQFDPALHAGHSLLQSAAYPSRPPSIMPRPELAQAQASLFRSYEDQFSHQLSAQQQAHEQFQRQLMERERMLHFAAAASQMPHPQFQLQEEYLRQRERELKLRTYEDAARNGRPPM